jgi:hypothetical protein
MSRFDRILVSQKWLEEWENVSLGGLKLDCLRPLIYNTKIS